MFVPVVTMVPYHQYFRPYNSKKYDRSIFSFLISTEGSQA
jgi:hypothetical protein